MVKVIRTNEDLLNRGVSEVDDMYRVHVVSMFPQFNAYRVDLDILMIEHCDMIVAYDDGTPIIFGNSTDITTTKWIDRLKKLLPCPYFDVGLLCKFMSQALAERPESEKLEDQGAYPHVNYVALHKEYNGAVVQRCMGFGRYDPRESNLWPVKSPILDINNNPLMLHNTMTLSNRFPVYQNFLTSPMPPVGCPSYPGPICPPPIPKFYGPEDSMDE